MTLKGRRRTYKKPKARRQRSNRKKIYKANLLPMQPLLHNAHYSGAIPGNTVRVGYQVLVDVHRLVGRCCWYTVAFNGAIQAANWLAIDFDPVLNRVAGYRAFQLLTTAIHTICANNSGKLSSALLIGQGFAQNGQIWNADLCN